MGPTTSSRVTDFSHPTLLLLGPIELTGAAGPPPPRAERSCIEYCAWLLEHPGATATAMANALVVAEGTRRSNVSRLRTWLGSADDGQQYLPDAYSGRLYLDPCVSSDWHRLQLLIAPGVGRVTRDTLVAALTLVRGAPLADAAPGQWHWAEELRTDMSSTIRDIGVVVADGAVADGDIDLGRALQELGDVARRGSAAIIITATADAGWLPHLTQLSRRGLESHVLLLDRASFGGQGSSEALRATIALLGYRCQLLRRGEVGRPLVEAEHHGFWEFKVTGTGRAIAVRRPFER